MAGLGKLVVLLVAAIAVAVQGKNLRLAPSAQVAGATEFPHQVSIQLDGRHHCGGALISKRHVLTAAHCVRGFILDPTPAAYKGQRLVVEVGATTIGSGTRHAIKRVSEHRQFTGDNLSDPLFMLNDIAVITLKTPVTESAKVKPISLPAASSELPVGSQVTISGFGNAQIGGPTSNYLKKSPMTTVSQQECSNYYTQTFHKTITSSQICAKQGRGYGTCQGDSGGPLVQGSTIVGVVSGGNGNCGSGYPDVYTKVSHFISYIQYELNYDPKNPGSPSSLALAVNIDEATAPVQPQYPGYPPQYPGYPPQYPGYPPQQPGGTTGIQFIDPNTGAFLPPGSVVLVDPNTGMPIVPVSPQFPQIPLYPVYPIYTLVQGPGFIQQQYQQYYNSPSDSSDEESS